MFISVFIVLLDDVGHDFDAAILNIAVVLLLEATTHGAILVLEEQHGREESFY